MLCGSTSNCYLPVCTISQFVSRKISIPVAFVVCHCITTSHKTEGLKQQTCISLPFLWASNSKTAEPGYVTQVLRMLQSGPGLQSPTGLLGSLAWLLAAGSVSCILTLAMWAPPWICWCVFITGQLASHRGYDPRENKEEPQCFL